MRSIVFDTNMFDELARPSHSIFPFDVRATAIRSLITNIDDTKQRIVIPTPVMAEVLSAQDRSVKDSYLTLHRDSFFTIAPLDEPAAAEAANITRRIRPLGTITQNRANNGRQEVKVDILIIAIALVNGARVIYSTDPHFKTIAERANLNIEVKNKDDILREYLKTH